MENVVKVFAEATDGPISNTCLVATRTGETRTEAIGGTTVHYLRQAGTFLLAPILPSLPSVLHRLRREEGFPVILLHYPNPTAIIALFLSLLLLPKREKLVLWYHADVLLTEWWKRVLYWLFQPIEEFVFRRTDAFVAATPHHISCSKTLRRFAARTAIIPFAVPDGWFLVTDEERRLAEQVRERLGGAFLLFVGRLVPYKGLSTLIRAAVRIPCRIAIVGTGPLEDELRQEVSVKGLADRVLLLGHVADLRPYYLGCEFFVLPSVSALEAFGIVQLEAMALGKPVVSSDLPSGVTYVNLHGETGLTFEAGNDSGFAESCNRLLSDPTLKDRLGRNARERTLLRFSYTALSETAIPFLRRLCDGDR